MTEKKFTNELKKAFEYIQTKLLKVYDCDKIPTEYFILSILENEDTVGNRVLSKIMLHDNIEQTKMHFYEWLSQNARSFGGSKVYDTMFEKCIKMSSSLASQQNSKEINSGHVLMAIFQNNKNISNYFRSLGISWSQISTQVAEETSYIEEEEKLKKEENFTKSTPVKHTHKETTKKTKVEDTDAREKRDTNIITVMAESNDEKCLVDLSKTAKNGKIAEVICCEKIYEQIFTILSKRNKNNVILTGASGVGKTSIARNLANLIEAKQTPKEFRNKKVFEVDFSNLISGTAMRGAFESRMKNILFEARQNGNYIFIIDSLGTTIKNEEAETFINKIIQDNRIMLVCTCLDKDYSKKIGDYPEWERFFERVEIEEPSFESCKEILKQHASKLEFFHNVKYEDSSIDICIKLSKRYISERHLPDSAIDILDIAGAKASLIEVENDNIRGAKERLASVRKKKEDLKLKGSDCDYEKIDRLEKEEIELQSILDYALKVNKFEENAYVITPNDIKNCISLKTGIPLSDLSVDDKEKLKTLNNRIKDVVIGQEEAVDSVCKAIKRQRIGINNPNKPVVLLMAGSTGVGKTYLAKTIAKELFGDENKMIRLDMGEYSDSTSVNKIIGASPGYIGYDKTNGLTEQIKKQKYCVLLLDEIEKAHEMVHNTFLNLFDEGRLTDNKGITVDFKNVIIVMTSNVGAREVEERGNGIGFVTNTEELKQSIIEKELRKKFKPEFINRIDRIVYFNKLKDADLRKIIELEIEKVRKRVVSIGYDIDRSIRDSALFEHIFNKVKEQKNLGARTIMREIQFNIEDKITDLIIDGEIDKNHVFTPEELFNT